ncbi:hypothetical protein EBH_0033300 [Eimeria brunetti]|uniref:Reverse transcriptase, related n=1 Tax=Eimeria brunetti TaxID=51314 RepID=U6LMA0_9EIME|nr:hypothetical protein EBH_0033300 [Eimeria brunetti]
MIGENPLTAADLDIVGSLAPTLTPPMSKLFQRLCDRAQSHIQKAKWQQKFYADSKCRPVDYQVGDRVWICCKPLPPLNNCAKFGPRYRGPFEVTERIGSVAHRITYPNGRAACCTAVITYKGFEKRAIGFEDGKNMRNFLDLVEINFVERGLEARQCGEKLKRYVTGDAVGYRLYLRRVSIAPDLLVGYYLANLPVEIYREITRGGTKKFADWQEAAAALATTAAPCRDSCEDRLRFQRDLEDANRRWANGGREPGLQRERASRGSRRNDTTDSRLASGPNSIRVSPDWGKRLLGREEQVHAGDPDMGENQQPLAVQSHAGTTLLIEEGHARKRDHSGELDGDVAEGDSILRVEVAGSQCEALLDTGASRSFISPGAVERLQLKVWRLPEECVFTVANGAHLRIDRVVKGLTMWCGATRLAGDFSVGPVPYDLVVGLDWLTNHRLAWYFQSDKLRTYVNGQWCDLPVVRANDVKQRKGSTQGMRQRTPAEQAYDILAKQLADMTREEATAFLRPPSKRYKLPSKRKRKAVVAWSLL